MLGRLRTRESRSTQRALLGAFGLAAAVALAPTLSSCAPPLDTERTLPKRGSVGQEMYGVLCDRLSAQALREDLTGASFRYVCHPKTNGEFDEKVDTAKLPTLDPAATDVNGKVVGLEVQRDAREKAIGRIEALARRRVDLVRAFDAIFPEDQRVGVKDLDNEDPTKSCEAPKKGSEAKLTTALADMLGRMTELYHDGTLPQSTQSLGRVVAAFKDDDEAQAAWARIASREGYRPIDTALGVARPAVAYPNLRDLANASLSLLSADSLPYQLDPKRDEAGKRIPVPGPGNAALNAMLAAAHEELLDAKKDPKPGPLTITADPTSGRVVLSRPRDNLEVMETLLFTTDPAFSVGAPRWIVKRDPRGYAAIAGGQVPTPFVDADKDGLPDVDDLGRFKTTNGSLAPSPFPYPNGPEAPRDEFGRALAGTRLLYDYVDTSSTFAAQVTKDLRPLADPDPAKEALMGVMGGAYVAMGTKGPATKAYARTTLEYQGYDVATSPMLDLVYAMSQLLGDKSMDTTLAMARELVVKNPRELARLTGALLAAQDAAKTHDEAKISKSATFWDESLDTMVKLVKEPGLLEDVLRAMAAPESQALGSVFSQYSKLKDEIRYDFDDLNGPTFNVTTNGKGEMKTPVDRGQPQIGKNRSALYRFLGAISDTVGVTACNKPDAIVHARGVAVLGTADICKGGIPGSIYGGCGIGGRPFKECEVFKIENLGAFYLDAIAGVPSRGTLYIRDDFMRSGIGGIGAANAETMEESSGILGFWGSDLRPKPQWLNRLVFFDFQNDKKNDITKRFLLDLNGEHIGSSICPERVIDDPVPSAPDAAQDGKVRGLRNCPEGAWLEQRHKTTIFTWENFGFYQAMKPLAAAFATHKREDIFLELSSIIYKHYPGEESTPAECVTIGNKPCPKTGLLAYEPLMGDVLATDVIGGLSELSKVLDTMAIKRCDEADAKGTCTKATTISGIDVAAAAARAALDPDYAKTTLKLVDRRGQATAKRNDGTTNPQVTPVYLITSALSAIDDAFDQYEQQTGDKERRLSWRRARSAMIDQFFGVDGARSTATFKNPTVTKMGPVLIDVLRAQLLAQCPKSFNAPYERCAWARDELTKKASDSLAGPLASAGLEMMEAIRKDPEGRQQMAKMVQYMTDAGSSNDALASMLASMNDVVQILRDDDNLVPFYKVLAAAMDASKKDAQGRVTEKSLVDAQMALLARVSGRAFDENAKEICSREVDPNQILSKVLANAVTPIKDGDFKGQTPVEVILDVIADVNRADPTQPYEGTLAKSDYANVSEQVLDFLTNKERGLEQFYEVVRQGTTF